MAIIRAQLSEKERAAADQLMVKALEDKKLPNALASVRAGADPTLVSADGISALWLAARAKDTAAAIDLLRAGAPLDRPVGFPDHAEFKFPDEFVSSQPEHREMLKLFSAWRASAALGHEPGTPAFEQSLASLRESGSVLDTFLQTVNVGGYGNTGHNALVFFSAVRPAAIADDNVAAISFSAHHGSLHYDMPRQQILESGALGDPEDQVMAHRIRPTPSTYLEPAVVTWYDDEQYHDYVRGTLFFSKDGSSLDAFVADRPSLLVTAALDDAIAERRHDAMRAAIKAGADAHRLCDGGTWTAMFAAVAAKDPVAVEIIVSQGVPVDSVDFAERTPLHHAAMKSFGEDEPNDIDERIRGVITALVEHGANVNALDYSGRSPLHIAVMYDNAAAIAALLQVGADPTVRDKHGKTPEEHIRSPETDETSKIFASWRAQQVLAAGHASATPAP